MISYASGKRIVITPTCSIVTGRRPIRSGTRVHANEAALDNPLDIYRIYRARGHALGIDLSRFYI